MKKKGFTLIELLAVIVILAIIALITMPTILGVIEKAKKGAAESSVLGYIDAVEKQIALDMLDSDNSIKDDTYNIFNLSISYKGKDPEEGKVTISNSLVEEGLFKYDGYYICYYDNQITSSKTKDDLLDCSDLNDDIVYQEAILNGAYPEIKGDLIPVTIDDDGTVHKADINTRWYSYKNKVWANAVILKSNTEYEVNEVIPEDNIDSYFVWIPRYKYKIFNTGEYTSEDIIEGVPTSSNAQTIEIVFESKETSISTGTQVGQYLTHPAFTSFGVNGIWVGKFETSGTLVEESNGTTTYDIDVKPNVTSLSNQTVSTFFTLGYNYNRILDSHMMKNTEWGAVAYLSHSIYGINKEVNINNNSDYITGYSAVVGTDQSSYPGTSGTTKDITLPYNTTTGYLASTTGNISGVYDMSGGLREYMSSYTLGRLGSSDFETDPATTYGSKYFDIYDASSTTTDYKFRILGDTTGEMGPFYSYEESNGSTWYHNSWYGDAAYFVGSGNNSWPLRGGGLTMGNFAGQFYFGRANGSASVFSFRLVLAF